MSSSIDFRAAERRAARLVPPGPRASRAELDALVHVLRAAAGSAPAHVAAITGLHEAGAEAARRPVFVIDRARWAEANVAMFAHLTGDLLPEVTVPGAARLGGEELGIMLSVLSTKVLGQFDPFTPARHRPGQGVADPAGRLLLVAPNVLHVERELDLDAMDFRLWVCLHEQTHAVQFAAAPWLADHLASRLRALVGGMSDPEDGRQRIGRAVRAVLDTLGSRGGAGERQGAGPLVEAFLTPAEREHMASAVAVMSLLEGHADVVMDAVGPQVLPSIRRIRASFEKRRDGTGMVDILLRRLTGMDAKVAQYRDGAAFVRGVVAKVGHDGLNAVWTAPPLLPTPAEIADPDAWVRRVHG
ncbi:zinc-dependent metalloprotease [Georgenia faecalis]|uniref:Zinc-dependent metalloprotease n=1 Tax=Georgenia faecalis TaxID=2483799 RepID=A0ABV9DEL5_9MICO|nr:zinc-dependent metalloprotease [Georgenia faecalis]